MSDNRESRSRIQTDPASLCSRVPDSMPVEAALLSRAVGVTRSRVIGFVGPFSLDFPLCSVAEGDKRDIEGPCAFVAIFLAFLVVPCARGIRICPCLREFVAANVSKGGQALRM